MFEINGEVWQGKSFHLSWWKKQRIKQSIYIYGGGISEDGYRRDAPECCPAKWVSQGCKKGYWGDAGSWRFPFHPEKWDGKLACHSAGFSVHLLQIRRKLRFKMSKLIMQAHLEGSSAMCLRVKVQENKTLWLQIRKALSHWRVGGDELCSCFQQDHMVYFHYMHWNTWLN